MKPSNCPSCGTEFSGNYCSNCGERLLNDKLRSIGHLFSHLIEEVTSLDGKLFKTLKLFFLKPGYLCLEFRRGIRKPYLSPVTVFFVFNLLYFFSAPLSDFNLSLIEQVGTDQFDQPYSPMIVPVVESYIAENMTTFEEVAKLYDVVSPTVAKSLVIVSVPFFALLIWLVNLDRNYFSQDHIVFALSIYSWVLIWPMFLKTVMGAIFWLFNTGSLQNYYLALLSVGLIWYMGAAQKTFYGNGWPVTCIKTLALIFAFFISHFIYRFIQFWLTWWQVV